MKRDSSPEFQDEIEADDVADDAGSDVSEEEGYERADRLMYLLDKTKASGGMSFIEMDGFLHGVACLPGFIPPSRFVPLILGDDANAGLMSRSEMVEATQDILWWWNEIQAHVVRGHFFCQPWICPDSWDDWLDDDQELADDEDFEQQVMEESADQQMPGEPFEPESSESSEKLKEIVAGLDRELREEASEWAGAFLGALDMGGALERVFEVERAQMYLIPVLMLAKNERLVEEDSPGYGQPLSSEAHQEALDLLPGTISALYQLFHGPGITKTKIARNAPCPCGSGKKYKKCCLGKPTKAV